METPVNTTDRELLELAAKAFWPDGEVSTRFDENEGGLIYIHADNQDHNGQDCERVWNPRDDDGDSRRLEVATNLTQRRVDGFAIAYNALTDGELREPIGNDPCAATRLVVLRAAAEIGRAMPS